MRKICLIALLLLAALLFSREMGWIGLDVSQSWSQTETSSSAGDLPRLNGAKPVLMKDPGTPFRPLHGDSAQASVIVTYHLDSSLSPWRWMPLCKWGTNTSQITYLVWLQGELVGCGMIYSTSSQKIYGLSSARSYGEKITQPLYEKMVKTLEEKYGAVTVVPPGFLKTEPHTDLASGL